MSNYNSNYQGFTGENYDEDERERRAAGGGIHYFPINNYDVRNSVLEKMAQAGIQPNLQVNTPSIVDIANQEEEYKKLEDIRQNIMNRQKWADAMIDDARQKYPGVDDDIRNNKEDHFDEFASAYPDFLKLQNEQKEYEKQFQQNPFNKQFMDSLRNK